MCRWMDGWMDGWTDGWMLCMYAYAYVCMCVCIRVCVCVRVRVCLCLQGLARDEAGGEGAPGCRFALRRSPRQPQSRPAHTAVARLVSVGQSKLHVHAQKGGNERESASKGRKRAHKCVPPTSKASSMHQKQPVGSRRCSTTQKTSSGHVSFLVAGKRSSSVLSRKYRTAGKNRRLHPLGHRILGVRVAPARVQQREKHDEAQPRQPHIGGVGVGCLRGP